MLHNRYILILHVMKKTVCCKIRLDVINAMWLSIRTSLSIINVVWETVQFVRTQSQIQNTGAISDPIQDMRMIVPHQEGSLITKKTESALIIVLDNHLVRIV
jgi:hypothetical protein